METIAFVSGLFSTRFFRKGCDVNHGTIVDSIFVGAFIAEVDLRSEIRLGRFVADILGEMDLCFTFFAKTAEHGSQFYAKFSPVSMLFRESKRSRPTSAVEEQVDLKL